MDRKEFIKSLGLSAAGVATFNSLQSFQLANTNLELGNQSWKEISKNFKVLENTIYMNNGTMGINPNAVLESIAQEFEKMASTGKYPSDMDSLKTALSRLLHVDSKTLAITKNVTEGINIACWGNSLKSGDEVLMTTHEHVGGCAAWLYRAKTEGIKIKTFPLGNTAEETLVDFKKALSSKTKIVAVPHMPCTIGQILPVKEICRIAKERNIISIIDGAHPLGMLRVNIQEIGCDYYAGCLHKWLLAPLGMGFVYINPEKLNQTNIYNVGAYSVPSFDMTKENPVSDNLVDSTQRFCTGSFSGPLYNASVKAIEWYEAIGVERIEKRVKELSFHVQKELGKYSSKIKILTPIEEISRGAVTTFEFKNKKANDFLAHIAKRKEKMTLRHVHEGGLDGIRVSTHYYNSEAHIDALIRSIDEFIIN